jgi:hypothetical protein
VLDAARNTTSATAGTNMPSSNVKAKSLR